MQLSSPARPAASDRVLKSALACSLAARSGRRASVAAKAQKKEIMMWEALREAIDEEMERDPTVCVMGKRCGLHLEARLDSGLNWGPPCNGLKH